MVQLVLLSESAGEFVNQGKGRLNELRQQGRKYATSYLATRHGYIIAQILGSVERIIIDNKPPYLMLDVLQTVSGIGDERYLPTYGGVTGEPYALTSVLAPPEFNGVDVRQATSQYQASGQYAYTTLIANVSGIYCYMAVVVVDTYANSMRFVYGNYSIVNAVSEAFCAFAPVGKADDGGEHMAYSFRKIDGPDDNDKKSFVSVVLQNTGAANPPDTTVWPFVGDNDGYTNEIGQVVTMANAGRMRVAWFQEYADTMSGPTLTHRAENPKFVVYNAQAGTYTIVTLRSLTPELEPFFATDPEAYNRISPYKGIAYCGNGVLLMCFRYTGVPGAEKLYMFRSDNFGASWTKVTLPVADGEEVNGGLFNQHGLRSLAKGKVIMNTFTSSGVFTYYSTDAGLSWTLHGEVNTSPTSKEFSRFLATVQAPRRKFGKEYVYTATYHVPSAGEVYELVFDSFSPSANLIGEPVLISKKAAYTPTSQRFNSSAYAERGAPLLQGYAGELEGTA